MDGEALVGEPGRDQLARLRLGQRQQPGLALQQGDLGAEPGEHLGELAPHRPATQHDLIAKPFLATELALKALTLIVKSKTVAA